MNCPLCETKMDWDFPDNTYTCPNSQCGVFVKKEKNGILKYYKKDGDRFTPIRKEDK